MWCTRCTTSQSARERAVVPSEYVRHDLCAEAPIPVDVLLHIDQDVTHLVGYVSGADFDSTGHVSFSDKCLVARFLHLDPDMCHLVAHVSLLDSSTSTHMCAT